MKRSEINKAIRDMEQMLGEYKFSLPEFCGFAPKKWKYLGHEYDEVRDNALGWDITDVGEDRFTELGFSLITLRNGSWEDRERYPKPYAEKLLMMYESQSFPLHFHFYKMEDIINRGGGNVIITVYNSTPDGGLSDEDVKVTCDGHTYTVPAGTGIRLVPGSSITVQQYLYHSFSVEPGTGPVLLGEISMCNNDNADNRFYEEYGRFPKIEEDEPPYRLLCNEYPPAED